MILEITCVYTRTVNNTNLSGSQPDQRKHSEHANVRRGHCNKRAEHEGVHTKGWTWSGGGERASVMAPTWVIAFLVVRDASLCAPPSVLLSAVGAAPWLVLAVFTADASRWTWQMKNVRCEQWKLVVLLEMRRDEYECVGGLMRVRLLYGAHGSRVHLWGDETSGHEAFRQFFHNKNTFNQHIFDRNVIHVPHQ